MADAVDENQTSARRYVFDPSELFQKALAALRELESVEGEGAVERAFATIVSGTRESAYAVRLTAHKQLPDPDDPYWSAKDLVPSQKRVRFVASDAERHLHGEHESHWSGETGEPQALVFQPYGVAWEELCLFVDLGREYDLRFDIDASHSWHFPGKSVLVEIRAKRDTYDPTLFRMLP